jgi:hypothetical protein
VDQVGETWVFNPGRQIGAVPTCISLDLVERSVEWTSFQGPVRRMLSDLRVAGAGA